MDALNPTRTTDADRRRLTDESLTEAATATGTHERQAALARVILANLGVARSLAAQFRDRGMAAEDLEQVAYVALVAAANRFDTSAGGDFLSFAVPTIRGEIRRHFRDFGWTVRPPRRVQEIHLQVLATKDRLGRERGRVPTVAELAEVLGESPQHVAESLMLDGCYSPTSLDQPLASGSGTIGDLIRATEDPHEAAEARAMLAPHVRVLADRDRDILRLRFIDGLTQQEIGERLGVTQTQVSRILSRILSELREALTVPRSRGLAA